MLSLVGVNHRALRVGLNAVVGIGVIVGGWWAVEARLNGRYASAAEFREHQRVIGEELRQLHIGQLETRLVILRREQFDLQTAAARRALSDLEWQRRGEVNDEIARVLVRISELEGRR